MRGDYRRADQQIGRSNFIMNTTNGGFVYNPSKCMCANPLSQPRFLCVLVRNVWIVCKREHCAVYNDNWHNNLYTYSRLSVKNSFFCRNPAPGARAGGVSVYSSCSHYNPDQKENWATARTFTSFRGIIMSIVVVHSTMFLFANNSAVPNQHIQKTRPRLRVGTHAFRRVVHKPAIRCVHNKIWSADLLICWSALL